MEERAAKTIDDYRDDCQRARDFYATQDLHPSNER
jgi:hypothetical protein